MMGMETHESREVGFMRAHGVSIEPAYPSHILGWSRQCTPVNSLVPFGNLITTSTGESNVYVGMPEPRLGALKLIFGDVMEQLQELPHEAFYVAVSDSTVVLRGENMPLAGSERRIFDRKIASVFIFEERPGEGAVTLPEDQRFSRFSAEPGRVARRSGIDVAPGVGDYARSVGALEDVSVIAELCLRVVPQTKRVVVTVTRDPEDGTAAVHFRVWTSATIENVVESEDELHEALFSRIPPVRRNLFSIGYEFIR